MRPSPIRSPKGSHVKFSDNWPIRKHVGMSVLRLTRSHYVATICVVGITLYLLYTYINIAQQHQFDPMDVWKGVNHEEIPAAIWTRAEKIEVKHSTFKVKVADDKVETYMRFADSYDEHVHLTPVLLLHGASFSSRTWLDLKTIQFIAALGHKVVAIDLPGYGETPSAPDLDKVEYLEAVVKYLDIPRPIVVTPSMSGSYAIPYIVDDSPGKSWQRASGLVAIAPVATKTYTHAQYHRVGIPVLILRGENDKQLGLEASSSLQNIASNKYVEFPKAGHACYMDDTPLWHLTLYNFLVGVEQVKLQNYVENT